MIERYLNPFLKLKESDLIDIKIMSHFVNEEQHRLHTMLQN